MPRPTWIAAAAWLLLVPSLLAQDGPPLLRHRVTAARNADLPTEVWLREALLSDARDALLHEARVRAVALAAADSSAEALYWVAALAALQAETAGTRAKIRLGQEAFAASEAALERDPQHAGAHHVMGRLHAGVLRLSGLTRWVAGRLGLGGLLEQASWESASHHLRRAHELAPRQATYAFELGALLLSRGDTAAARPLLEDVIARPAPDGWQQHLRLRACALLQEASCAAPRP
ncbi:MAG: hypothetical protein R3E98_00385 [Gemmatimonadota bacterium]|nr:hypothetical protein [Gemmatimonadota bacterium]